MKEAIICRNRRGKRDAKISGQCVYFRHSNTASGAEPNFHKRALTRERSAEHTDIPKRRDQRWAEQCCIRDHERSRDYPRRTAAQSIKYDIYNTTQNVRGQVTYFTVDFLDKDNKFLIRAENIPASRNACTHNGAEEHGWSKDLPHNYIDLIHHFTIRDSGIFGRQGLC
jgi:hypothetical protein